MMYEHDMIKHNIPKAKNKQKFMYKYCYDLDATQSATVRIY